ncbi:hypothetical protein FJT64_001153 [Amphibalanus amphitrite]|uniref:LRRCT domain-containing protein n=1 Tax=Amphibalanus amphitrite TaxID=1232801 RepID=A0A6A4VI52_AMPAM|nr:hypothetical protein FJT64_001153 [Amphibalanus amphitrite]
MSEEQRMLSAKGRELRTTEKENPLICNCDMVWFKEWITNHSEKEEFQSLHHDPHCRKYDSRHIISVKKLPRSEFNCPTGGQPPAAAASCWLQLLLLTGSAAARQ